MQKEAISGLKGSSTLKHTLTGMGDLTKVVKAHSKQTGVIRTSIPASVRNALKLQEGDQLDWQLETKDGRIVAVVTKKD